MSDFFIVPAIYSDQETKFSVDPNDMNNWVLSPNYSNQLGKYKYVRYEDLPDNLKEQLKKTGSITLVNDNRRSVDYDTVSAEQQPGENGNKTVYRIAVTPDGQSIVPGSEYDAWQQYVMNPNHLYLNEKGEVEIMPEGEKPYGQRSVLQPYHDSYRRALQWVYRIPGHEGEPISEQDAKAWGLTTGNIVYGKDDWNDPSENFMNEALFALMTLPAGGVKLTTDALRAGYKAVTTAAKKALAKVATKELAKQTGMQAGKLFAKYVAGPTALAELFNLTNRGVNYLVGESDAPLLTELVTDKLKGLGVNETVAQLVGDSTNPGWWVNFGGGKYTGQLLQKAGLGLEKTMSEKLAEKAGAQFLARMKEAKDPAEFQKYYKLALDATREKLNQMGERVGKLVPAVKEAWQNAGRAVRTGYDKLNSAIDNNLYKLQTFVSPISAKRGGKRIISNDYEIKTIQDAIEKGDSGIMRAVQKRLPENWENPFSLVYSNNVSNTPLIQNMVGSASAADLFLNGDDRPWWMKAIEWTLAGKAAANHLIMPFVRHRIGNKLNRYNTYADAFNFGKRLESSNYYYTNRMENWKHNNYFTQFGKNKKRSIDIEKDLGDDFDKLANIIKVRNQRGNSDFTVTNDNEIVDNFGNVLFKRAPDGKIYQQTGLSIQDLLNKHIDFPNYRTGQRYVGNITFTPEGDPIIPDEYLETLRSNKEFIDELFPDIELKIFGSAGPVLNARFPHATGDLDYWITESDMNKLLQKYKDRISVKSSNEKDPSRPLTWKYDLGEKFGPGDSRYIDLNVIYTDKDGMAMGSRAEELFRQYFPEEYKQAVLEGGVKAGLTNPMSVKINKTPKELFDKIDDAKSIVDSFAIDYEIPNKAKHKHRSIMHLTYSDNDQVAQAIQTFKQSILESPDAPLFPWGVDRLTDVELNMQALKKIGFNLSENEMKRIAKDPARMKNVLDAWYLMDRTPMRYIKGTWPPDRTTVTKDNFIKSATTWIDNGPNGGEGSGKGLNTTVTGDSGHGGPIKAYISPKQNYKSDNLLDLIDEIDHNFGLNLSVEDQNFFRRLNYKSSTQAASDLLDYYNRTGRNFIGEGSNYRNYGHGIYASGTRHFDPTLDYIGFAGGRSENMNGLARRLEFKSERPIGSISIPKDKDSIKPIPMFPKELTNSPGFSYKYNYFNDTKNYSINAATTLGIGGLTGLFLSAASNYNRKPVDEPSVKKEDYDMLFTKEGQQKLIDKYKKLGVREEAVADYIIEQQKLYKIKFGE